MHQSDIRADVFRMIESFCVLRSHDFISFFAAWDHFRVSLHCTSSERQTARDRRHGINIDLRILP